MDQTGKKDFMGWIKIKRRIHFKGSLRTINDGDIWWCRIGENVGNEICGKGKDFLRPVIIIHKLTRYNFIGVPLTSKEHSGSWYIEFEFKEKKQFAVVSQVENISTYRLHHKMGEVPQTDLDKVLIGLCNLLATKISPNQMIRTGGYPRKSNSIITRIITKVKQISGTGRFQKKR